MTLPYPKISITQSYLTGILGKSDMRNVQSVTILRSMCDEVNVHNSECDKVYDSCEYLPGRLGSCRARHFLRTEISISINNFSFVNKLMKRQISHATELMNNFANAIIPSPLTLIFNPLITLKTKTFRRLIIQLIFLIKCVYIFSTLNTPRAAVSFSPDTILRQTEYFYRRSRSWKIISYIRTVCPFCSWTGKHMLHLAQWKNRSRPPTLHIPQPSQWYWFLSSSSNRLHSRHVYLPKRQWQFWHVACTGWRVSHKTHISSVTSFLFTVWVSSLSWQNRHVYTLLQHGVYEKRKVHLHETKTCH